MNANKLMIKRIIFIFCIFLLLCLLYYIKLDQLVILADDSGSIALRLNDYVTVNGWQKDDVTYFFLPSFVKTDKIVPNDKGTVVLINDKPAGSFPLQTLIKLELMSNGKSIYSENVMFYKSDSISTMCISLNDTDMEKDNISHDEYINMSMSIIEQNGTVSYSSKQDQIKGHGNVTWTSEKKPYMIKLSSKHSLCNMRPGKKWILFSNPFDRTHMYNKLMYDLGNDFDFPYSPQCEYVDLYINGEYLGNYLLSEILDVDNEHLNIDDGYFIEKDYPDYAKSGEQFYFSNQNHAFTLKYPLDAKEEQQGYIYNYIQIIENLIETKNQRIKDYIDLKSFAKKYVYEEFALDYDAYVSSCYYIKKADDDKLYAGPPWDYDSGFGNGSKRVYWADYTTSILQAPELRGDDALNWDTELAEYEEFQELSLQYYQQLEPLLENILFYKIDLYYNQIKASMTMDDVLWLKLNEGHYSSFEDNVRYLKYFVAHRINWMNQKWNLPMIVYDCETKDGYHTVQFDVYGNITEISVRDGQCLTIDQLPVAASEDEEWIYGKDEVRFNTYYPVYEDVILILQNKHH